MNALPKNPVIEHRPETLHEVRKVFGLEKPEVLNESIDLLQDWISKQPYLNKKDFDRDYLEGFIVRAKGSVEKAKKRLDDMCTYRTLYPHMYEAVKVSEMKNVHNVKEFALPKQTKDNCTIFFIINNEKDYGEEFALNYHKRMIVVHQFLYHYDYNNGLMIISDLRGTELMKQITEMLNPYVLKLCHNTSMSAKAYGGRVHGVHVITESNAIDKFLYLLKPFFSKLGRIYVHKSLESLYEHLDKDLLPEDYGGKQEASDVLYEKWVSFVSSDEMLKKMETLTNATVDTNIKKVCDEFDTDLGVSGTFRKLNVD